jgi:membrane protease YdiL (CAAX protease family)
MRSVVGKIRRIAWSAILAFLILLFGQGVWGALLFASLNRGSLAVLISFAIMAVVLWLMWSYLGGRWWPRGTTQIRHRYRRANPVSATTFFAAFLAGVLAIVALAGYWIVFCQVVRTPPNLLPDMSQYPALTITLVLVMSSLVSPITEEIGFRGYCQQILEQEFNGPFAICISSFFFMLAHGTHGWFLSKLTVYFLVGVTFGLIAYLANSILTSIPVHIVGDLSFFIFIWPHDSTRRLITEGGADSWFWIHLVQAILFTVLSIVAFKRLARITGRSTSHT